MNKKIILAGIMAYVTIGFCSCNDESNEILKNEIKSSRAISDVTMEKIDFIYKGTHYETTSTIISDSVVAIDNPSIEILLLELDSKPNLITFSYPDGTLEYFDDMDDFNINKDRVFALSVEKEKYVKQTISPRGVVDSPNSDYVANLFIHDDRNYDGRRREFDLAEGQKQLIINQLRDYDMNDKTSSFVAITMKGNTLFELFEDDHCRSHCFSFLVTPSTQMGINSGERTIIPPHGKVCAPNLKNIHVKGTNRSSWNDRITSIRMTRQ